MEIQDGEAKVTLCGECSCWRADAKRMDGIRYGACTVANLRTKRTTICRVPDEKREEALEDARAAWAARRAAERAAERERKQAAIQAALAARPKPKESPKPVKRGPRGPYHGHDMYRPTQAARLKAEGLSYEEIGDIMGICKTTVRDYIRQADKITNPVGRKKLKQSGMPIPVIGENIRTGEILRFSSMAEAASCGFEPSLISKCCNGRYKSHLGYRWRKAEAMDEAAGG